MKFTPLFAVEVQMMTPPVISPQKRTHPQQLSL